MKKTLAVAAMIVGFSFTAASAQMMMNNNSKPMTQEQMNEMARQHPIPGAGNTGPTPTTTMAPAMGGKMMKHKKMHHSMKKKM